jgi:serine/threonine-protein kinase
MVPPNESETRADPISAFLQAVRTSSALSERQLEKLEASVAEGEYPSKPAEVAARLVKDGLLTEYQARQILKGKAENLAFGRYIILDFLGKGMMGKVYKAWHRMMGRVVALKILDAQYVSSTRSIARFQREMQLVGRLDHPNVIRAFDADRVGDCHYIAMEFAAGVTLEDLMKERGALPPADVVYYAAQAAEGLAHAHARGVVHRDIKPSNLMLTEGRKVKVLDFGLGTLLEKDESSALTTAGLTVGTPDYISPEQARMVKIDGRSDLYSLGCTMYHLLSGQLPFKGESSMDCIVGRITGRPIPIGEVRTGLPPRLVESLEKLMASNPDDRYQTADEAAAALRSLLRPKNAPPSRSASTATAIPLVPEPVAKRAPTPEGTVLPPRTAVRLSKPKSDTRRARKTGRPAMAYVGIGAAAVAAVALVGATVMLFRSSNSERPASQQASSPTPKDELPPSPPAALPASNPPIRPAGGANVRQPGLVIESPKEGATVDMKELLTGRLESDGWPVIFVQADIPGQPWWCQAPVEKVDGGRFSTNVVFGDDFTKSGTKFRVAGIVARTREDAIKFDMGSKAQALPEGYPQSAQVVVTHR